MGKREYYDPNAEMDPNSPQNSKYNTKESNECWDCYSEECKNGCLQADE